MARRRSASIQARHVPGCALGKPWTPLDGLKGCTCKTANGRGPLFHIVSRPNGKQIRTAVGYDREDARRQLLSVLGDIDDGTHEAPKNCTYNEWVDQWFASLRRPNENTKRSYRAMIGYSKKAFGDKTVRHVTTGDVVRMLDLVKHTSPTTQNRYLRELHSVLESARKQKPPLTAINAVAELGASQKPRTTRRKASPFECAELVKLWKHLDDPYLTVCKLSAATGMRQGELVALRWGNVDFAKRVANVRAVYTPGIGFVERAKSEDSDREVVLTPNTVEMLKAWRGRQETLPTATSLVFPGAGKDGQLVSSTLLRVLYAAMVEAGVPREWKPGHKWRDFHSFRHGFVSAAIGQGIGLEWIAEQLGHSSVSVTERNYKHFLTEARHGLAVGLDAALVL